MESQNLIAPQAHINPITITDTPSIRAESDQDAAEVWLRLISNSSPHTLIAYRKEISRFLAWCKLTDTTCRQLKVEGVLEFIEFLGSPPPDMIGPAKPKSHPDWRPFTKPLHPSSIHYSIIVIGNFLSFLLESKYIQVNPVSLYKRMQRSSSARGLRLGKRRKPIGSDNIQAAENWIKSECVTEELARGRWIFMMLRHSGLRLSEAARVVFGDIASIKGRSFASITGKGNKTRMVALPDEFIKEMGIFHARIGLTPTHATPLIPSVRNTTKSLTPRAIAMAHNSFCDFLKKEGVLPDIPTHPHIMRHTAATQWLSNGASLPDVRDQLGQSNVSTTSIYVTPDMTSRHDSINASTIG